MINVKNEHEFTNWDMEVDVHYHDYMAYEYFEEHPNELVCYIRFTYSCGCIVLAKYHRYRADECSMTILNRCKRHVRNFRKGLSLEDW